MDVPSFIANDPSLLDICARLRARSLDENTGCRLFAAVLPKLLASLRAGAASAGAAGSSAELPLSSIGAAFDAASSCACAAASHGMFSLAHIAARAKRLLVEEAGKEAASAEPQRAPPSLANLLQRELALDAQHASLKAVALATSIPASAWCALPPACATLPFTRELEAALLDGLGELQDELANVGAGEWQAEA